MPTDAHGMVGVIDGVSECDVMGIVMMLEARVVEGI